MPNQEIPLVNLDTQIREDTEHYSKSLLEGEIKNVQVDHVAITNRKTLLESCKNGYKTVYLFLKGTGDVIAENTNYEIVPETIFVPNAIEDFMIKSTNDEALHYVKISCKLSTQDQKDLRDLPTENTQNSYYAKFSDCKTYTEKIKSPNTTSRTILSNGYIPRVAMGTVRTNGPDEVAAHEHPMLEQLFLGLSNNNCIVNADDAHVDFPELSILHIPLGSSHSVSVEKNEIMHYVWMDFFLDKKGEEWLKTHKDDAGQ